MNMPNGDKYEGQFQENKKNGKGIFIWINGDKYEGEWVSDMRFGKGVFT